jgi:hypothetical protein
MFRIRGPLAANAAEFVVHPIIHVEDELSDRVRKSRDLPPGEFSGKIFNARQRVSMSALAAKQFGECA